MSDLELLSAINDNLTNIADIMAVMLQLQYIVAVGGIVTLIVLFFYNLLKKFI